MKKILAAITVCSTIIGNASADPIWYSDKRATQQYGYETAPYRYQELIGEEIVRQQRQFEKGSPPLCLPLRNFDPLRYQIIIETTQFDSEDQKIRMDYLVRSGLFTVTHKAKNKLVYSLTNSGKNILSEERCLYRADDTLNSRGFALVYAQYPFKRILATDYIKTIEGFPIGSAVIAREVIELANWSTDKDLRRAWGLPGVDDLRKTAWCYEYKITSNGAEITPRGACGVYGY